MKCIKNTPAYFAERLHKAMQVNSMLIYIYIYEDIFCYVNVCLRSFSSRSDGHKCLFVGYFYVFWTLYTCTSSFPVRKLWLRVTVGSNRHCTHDDDVFFHVGCGHQRQDSDPHHGDPLWGGHAGHQTGVSASVREVALHSHLCKSHTLYTVTGLMIYL